LDACALAEAVLDGIRAALVVDAANSAAQAGIVVQGHGKARTLEQLFPGDAWLTERHALRLHAAIGVTDDETRAMVPALRVRDRRPGQQAQGGQQ
jgi:hypothetical protein